MFVPKFCVIFLQKRNQIQAVDRKRSLRPTVRNTGNIFPVSTVLWRLHKLERKIKLLNFPQST